MFRSLLANLEELTLLILPHGGQRTARRNAWRAATDLHVTSGYRWTDGGPGPVAPLGHLPSAIPATRTPARPVAAHR
ncbi:hypothetical protein I6A84_13410 [Frankia sp. CNm7]|uniref:Uncharacterized protein n=1 Tax=Frankia nepalensis TaxID=1836974 RepID=A0A937UQN9_9ACTN|nr:hypothetical protein [Frankia nepalensis]MBL7497890.1 hypothetical protein [Frankia nepalensis]MBL7514386.1 hypothetical protein [Frankia nepalensis]MBL7519077.1 hypothetical protein [Frankia nepalensis]MBL7628455.1 hypothetical protein [Frankia nepalensis]